MELARCRLHGVQLCGTGRGIPQHGDAAKRGDRRSEQLQPFAGECREIQEQAGNVAARMSETLHPPCLNGVRFQIERNNGDDSSRRDRRANCSGAERAQDGGIELDQVLCETAEHLRVSARRSKLQDDVLSLGVTQFTQPRSQGSDRLHVGAGRQRGSDHDTHDRYLSRLLGLHGERRRQNVEDNAADERPPVDHWITSSARSRSDDGITRPSALAVFRLIISSSFAGCSIARSPGLAPFRIRST